jgi:hypothetical protein
LTQEQVAVALDWSLSKIIRIETGAVGISTTDLMALVRHYKIADADRANDLVALARAARQPSWWSKYRDSLGPRTTQFIEFEEAAYVIRGFESLVIPGLLQTEEYTHAVIGKLGDNITRDIIEARVEARATRQKILERASPPLFFSILDEAAIRRLIGEKAIVQQQIARLISMARKPNVTIEIVPFSAGLHRGMIEPFTILEFPDAADSDVLYLEGTREAVISQDEAGQISLYREIFEQLRKISLGPQGSLTYLAQLVEELA